MIVKKLIFLIMLLILTNSIYSQTFFEDGFETKTMGTPSPKWHFKEEFSPSLSYVGMMYGPGDIYSRSQDIAHSGNYSLKLQLDGRNNWCNTCGHLSYTMANGYSNVNFFVDSLERNASDFFNDLSNPLNSVYNKHDWFSKWQVDYVSGDRIYFTGNSPIQNDMGGNGAFNSGDKIFIPRVCGDPALNNEYGAPVGQDIDRRNDCNAAINYLQNIDQANDFDYGNQLSRRMYIYIPSSTQMPSTGIKLGYFHTKVYKPYLNAEEKVGFIIVNLVQSGNTIFIEAPGQLNSTNYEMTIKFTEEIKKDRWYYIEEVWTRETNDLANDGEYQLYFGEDGADVSTPIVNLTNVTVGRIIDMSIIGNWQHENDGIGPIYLDDLKIAQNRSGPTAFNPNLVGMFPSIPKNFQAINIQDQDVELNWSPSTDNNLSGYKIFRDDVEVGTTTINYYKDTGLTPDTTYTYYVKAYDTDSNTAKSSEIDIKTNSINLYNGNINQDPFNETLNKFLVGHWDFENYSSTEIFDKSKYKNSGQIYGDFYITNLTPISNTTNNYGVFDGDKDFIEFPHNVKDYHLRSNYSISFWVYPFNSSKLQRFVGRGSAGGSVSYIFNNDYVVFSKTGSFGTEDVDKISGFELNDNQWNHIVGVLDEYYMYVYINGFEYKKVFYGNLSSDNMERLVFGIRPFGYNSSEYKEPFEGYLDEVRIYNYSFNPQEVFSLYLDPFNISSSNSSICGNNITETNETCDGTDLNSKTCQSLGFDSGTLSCLNTCQDFDTSLCSYNSVSTCGNNTIEGSEICDGTDLNDTTCQSLGFDKGTLSCKTDCTGYITSSCSNDNSGGSNTGGGGGGSSSFCYSCIENINITNTCIPLYQYSEWSDCIDNLQSRFVEDLNNCEGDDYEQRSCQIELSEEENLILNSKLLTLNNYANKKYKTSLDSGYNEIFYVEEQLEDNIFLLQDEATGREYYGQYYDTIEDKHYYTLKRVDAGYITILQDEGILGGSLNDNSSQNTLLINLGIGFVVLLFFGAIGYAIYYFKKTKGKNSSY